MQKEKFFFKSKHESFKTKLTMKVLSVLMLFAAFALCTEAYWGYGFGYYYPYSFAYYPYYSRVLIHFVLTLI